MPLVYVDRFVKRLKEGRRYGGFIQVDQVRLSHELIFSSPFNESDLVAVQDRYDKREDMEIVVTRDGTAIELNDQEYWFFYLMIMPLFVGFCRAAHGEGKCGDSLPEALDDKSTVDKAGIRVRRDEEVSDDVWALLSSDKFGCSSTPTYHDFRYWLQRGDEWSESTRDEWIDAAQRLRDKLGEIDHNSLKLNYWFSQQGGETDIKGLSHPKRPN